jgi:hypothetical protein
MSAARRDTRVVLREARAVCAREASLHAYRAVVLVCVGLLALFVSVLAQHVASVPGLLLIAGLVMYHRRQASSLRRTDAGLRAVQRGA